MMNWSSLSRARIAIGVCCVSATALFAAALTGGAGIGLGALACTIAVSCLAALHFATRTARSIRRCADICAAVELGDFEVRIAGIREGGDVGEIMWSINGLIDRTDAYIRETTASMDHVSRNWYFRRIVETGMTGAFLGGAKTINAATSSVSDRVADFRHVAREFEATVFHVVDSVVSATTELDATAASMDTIARATEEQAARVAGGAEEASKSVQSVAASSELLSTSIAEIGTQAKRSSTVSGSMVEEIEQMHERMGRLEQAAGEVGKVADLIMAIAAQTNLLALNATIEAARAGEAGKGFAVVAQEVKQLAQNTARATDEVSAHVLAIQDATHEAAGGFGSIAGAIREIDDSAALIAKEVAEQSAATREIAGSVTQASEGTQAVTRSFESVSRAATESSHAAEEVTQASSDLAGQAERLRGEVDRFPAGDPQGRLTGTAPKPTPAFRAFTPARSTRRPHPAADPDRDGRGAIRRPSAI